MGPFAVLDTDVGVFESTFLLNNKVGRVQVVT